MQFIHSVLTFNEILTVSLLSWFVAQVLKTIINFVLLGRFQLERMWGDGGMPSAHSATVTAMVIATAGYVCDNSHGDTFGNAVEERHCDDTYITWDCLGHIAEINADNIAEHVQSNDHQSRSCGKGRDCQEDRRQEQGQAK